jgi:PAS domain S-box-containing protein
MQAISASYDHYEKDRELLEHSIEISSDEMIELNNDLRKEARELQMTYEELNRILNNIDEAFFSVNPLTYQYIFISPACEKIYGYSRDEFEAYPMLWKEVIHPDDLHIVSRNDELLARGEKLDLRYRIIHKNKRIRWVNVKVVRTLVDGVLVRRDAVVNDITDQIEAQQQLELTSRELSNLFNTIDDVMYSVDMVSYQVIQMSPSCEKVYGYKPMDFFEDNELWNRVMHPDDRYLLEDHFARINSGRQVKNQHRIIHRDGSIRWVENSVIPSVDATGRVIRLDGVSRDITDRKMIEQDLERTNRELNTLFNSIDEVIYSVDVMAGRVIQMSPACEKVYGYKPEDFYADIELWNKMTHPLDREQVAGHFAMLMAGEQVIDQCRVINRNNELRWVEYNMIPTIDAQGMLIRIDGVTKDITERKNTEQNIRALNESLEQKVKERTAALEASNKELEAFGYSVSHDLRAPLRIIRGYSNLLSSEYGTQLNDEAREYITSIMTNADHMSQLIDDLLNLSKLGRSALIKSPVNMNDLVTTVITELEEMTLSQPEIIIHELPCTNCDPNLIKQVWVNLVSNALKYSRKTDHPKIEIGSHQNGSLIYYIKDNGAGFDMKHAGKLFEVFQRLHLASDFEGTGVGLALTQRIISRHGGRIWADAKINEGATFYFTLAES